jgi:hypothetical protein
MSNPADLILKDAALQGALPADFLYGASSASYQIEGCTSADGRSDCVWDEVLRDAKDSGADACNSYKQWREDVQLVKDYGMNTYRFSIAWSRIRPKGEFLQGSQTYQAVAMIPSMKLASSTTRTSSTPCSLRAFNRQ